MKVKKFKEYLYGKALPYKLNFIDNNGHCLVCYKFVKSFIYKGESENFCDGCPLKNDDPICWQISVNDLIVAVDWKTTWSFRKDVIKNDISYLNVSGKRKKEITIMKCLEKTLSNSSESTEVLCCNNPTVVSVRKRLSKLPNLLIVLVFVCRSRSIGWCRRTASRRKLKFLSDSEMRTSRCRGSSTS